MNASLPATHLRTTLRRLARPLLLLSALSTAAACGGGVGSDEQARLAYVGLDEAVGKALTLGFAGFNAATSANIPAQSTTGTLAGTLGVSGQVDQGASTNKGMRLRVALVDYTDGDVSLPDSDATYRIAYDTVTDVATQPALDLQLRNIPNGTFSGTLAGTFQMEGDLDGEVTLSLTMSGAIEDDGTGKVRRRAGGTTVTGTAVSAGATYQVNVTL
jgi:hypothetical protein